MPIAQIGAETQVNTATTGDQNTPQAIALADGTYVVVWKTATGWSLQQFDANGSKVGSEVANTGVFPATWEALPDGRLAYAYRYGFFGHLFFGILNGDGSQSRGPAPASLVDQERAEMSLVKVFGDIAADDLLIGLEQFEISPALFGG